MVKQMMPLEVWSKETNFGVVRMPGRAHPGAVLQGDTLVALVANAERAHKLAQAMDNSELELETGNLLFDLKEILEFYSGVCKEGG